MFFIKCIKHNIVVDKFWYQNMKETRMKRKRQITLRCRTTCLMVIKDIIPCCFFSMWKLLRHAIRENKIRKLTQNVWRHRIIASVELYWKIETIKNVSLIFWFSRFQPAHDVTSVTPNACICSKSLNWNFHMLIIEQKFHLKSLQKSFCTGFNIFEINCWKIFQML